MMLVAVSLVLFVVGGAASLLLSRWPALALRLGMGCALTGCAAALVAAGDALLRPAVRGPYEVAWPLALGSASIALDGLSAWFLMTIAILGGCVAVYSVPYMSAEADRPRAPVFSALLCGLIASLIVLVCAADVVVFLVAWELMTVAAFLLVAFHHESGEVRRGAWMYLIATHIGTALFVLPLFGYVFARAGTTEFSAFPGALHSCDASALAALFFIGLVGFGTKAGFMPMHVWLPAAHPVAPTPVSALLSGVVVKTGIYGLMRLITWLPPLPPVCGEVLLLVAVVSGVMGVLYALAQHDLKRLLAYHTVENIGIIGLGLAVGLLGEAAGRPGVAVLGFAGALLHVTNHALFKGLLFLSAGSVMHATGTGEMERLGGLVRRMPGNAAMFLIGAVAICGLPPLNGFLSEWFVYGSLLNGAMQRVGVGGGSAALGVAALALMGGLALACFAKVFGVVFLGEPRTTIGHTAATPLLMIGAMAVLGFLCVGIGVAPGVWTPLVRSATGDLASASVGDVDVQMSAMLAPAARLSSTLVVFLVVAVGLLVLRRNVRPRLASGTGPARLARTWGCGYASPTPRMQYTASSFASNLVTSFRTLLWPQRFFAPPQGAFAGAAHLETHAPDIAEHDVFAPLFRGISRTFTRLRTVSWHGEPLELDDAAPVPERRGPLRTLTHGVVLSLRRSSIQMRLFFVVLTLVVLFAVEAASFRDRPMPNAPAARSVAPEGKGPR